MATSLPEAMPDGILQRTRAAVAVAAAVPVPSSAMLPTTKVTSGSLRRLPLFAGLEEAALHQLVELGRGYRLGAREAVSNSRVYGEESYCFVVDGVIGVTQLNPQEGPAATRYLGYFEAGDCFSDGFLAVPVPSDAARIDCVAVNGSLLLDVDFARLSWFLAAHPEWRGPLTDALNAGRRRFLERQEPGHRLVQDFVLQRGLVDGARLRVGDVSQCLSCGKCQAACAARHGGVARMQRGRVTLGCLEFPVTCQTCRDKTCLDACSFGGLVYDEARSVVYVSERCAGCGACVPACPHGAIQMVQAPYTTADFPDPIPTSGPAGMTNVDRLFVAGDIGGSALIRQAINEAVRAVDAIPVRGASLPPEVVDVAIVGAGPAGLSAALRCQERGLSCWVLEKDVLASTVRDYPKHKHVMAEPEHVPLLGSLWFDACTKEELLARWEHLVQTAGLPIVEHTEVTAIEPRGELFTVTTSQGELTARAVVLCIGKRGAPRRLGVPGEAPPRVRYALVDPEEFAGRDVLVVGGGDSALEAAVSLAEVPDCRVTLSYRRDAFTRAKTANRTRLQAAQRDGTLRVELLSTVVALEPGKVRLRTQRGEIELANDVAFALLGSDPPLDFLRKSRVQVLEPGSPEMAAYARGRGSRERAVKCDGCRDFGSPACLDACPTGALIEAPAAALLAGSSPGAVAPAAPRPLLAEQAFFEGRAPTPPATLAARLYHPWLTSALFVSLAALGVEVFLRSTRPEWSFSAWALDALGVQAKVGYGSGRGLGHWLGYIGASAMLASVVYTLRTRIRRFASWGRTAVWLSAHQWLGFGGATLVTYHSALKLDRWASVACYLMWIVVATGILGRYVRGRSEAANNVLELERQARSPRWSWWLERAALAVARAALRHWNLVHIVLAIAMFILAAIHIVYGFVYKAVESTSL